MKTIYYSEVLNKRFDTEEECLKAEKEYAEKLAAQKEAEKKAKDEKASRARAVEDAYKVFKDAEKAYVELRNKFVEDYGQFHMTYKDKTPVQSLSDFFDLIWFK